MPPSGSRSRGLPADAIEHAAEAGEPRVRRATARRAPPAPDQEAAAGRTFLRWVRTLPDDHVVEHPELAVAAAMSAVLVGEGAIEPRRFLRLADQANRRATRALGSLRRGLGTSDTRAHDRRWCRDRRCSMPAVRSNSPPPCRTRSSRALWPSAPAPSTSQATWTRRRPWPCASSSIPTPRTGCRAWRSPARRWRSSPSSADSSRSRVAMPRRRRRPWAASASAAAGSARTRPPRSARCWQPKESSPRPSVSSPRRSTSSWTRWRP